MPLRFADHEDLVFERAPLQAVLCQVRFEPVLSLLSDVGVAGFQEALRSDYPHTGVKQDTAVELTGGAVGVSQAAPIWIMNDESQTWQVSLAADFVALEKTAPYTNFGDFVLRMRRVLEVLNRTVHPGNSVRIGLRKVNHLQHPRVAHPADWSGLVRDSLLGLTNADLPGTPEQSLSQYRIHDEDDELTIQFGFLRDDQTTFLLDLDYSTQRAIPVSDADDIGELVEGFSNSITSFFHWALSDEMRDYLDPRPRSTQGLR